MNPQFRSRILVGAALLAFGTVSPVVHADRSGPSSGVDFVSGGVGLGARQAMLAQAGQYNLHVEFAAAPEGEYLSDVDVSMTDSRGQSVLHTRTDGPWLLARLPAGTYSLTAKYAGVTRTQQVAVGAGRRHIVMRFPAVDDKVAGVAPSR